MNDRLRLPAEWEPHDACWLAFPYLEEEWPLSLDAAQKSIAAVCRAIAGPGGEPVRLLVRNGEVEARARSLIGELGNIEYVEAEYGDCWLRDTAPVLGRNARSALGALRFEFNGWGGKYVIPFDDRVGNWLAARLDAESYDCPLVLEGGALESNGAGTILTTASCALNPNRNPGLTAERFEAVLSSSIAVDRVIWLEAGLAHDHTDGHVDMIARFLGPNTVFCMTAPPEAPNATVLNSIEQTLRRNGLNVIAVPAPPEIRSSDGAPLPASYCNFYIANSAVLVPVYGVETDAAALGEIENAFPERDVIGLPAADLLCGGGAFHCVTQAQPSMP